MIRIIKKEIKLDKELRSRIEWACNFAGYVPKIKERNFENDRTYKFSLCGAS